MFSSDKGIPRGAKSADVSGRPPFRRDCGSVRKISPAQAAGSQEDIAACARKTFYAGGVVLAEPGRGAHGLPSQCDRVRPDQVVAVSAASAGVPNQPSPGKNRGPDFLWFECKSVCLVEGMAIEIVQRGAAVMTRRHVGRFEDLWRGGLDSGDDLRKSRPLRSALVPHSEIIAQTRQVGDRRRSLQWPPDVDALARRSRLGAGGALTG